MEGGRRRSAVGGGAATRRVVVACAGAVPGLDLPVSAAGLRSFGLAEGLRAHGFAVTVLVVEEGARLRREAAEDGVEVVKARGVAARVEALGPAAVVAVDPLRLPRLSRGEGFTCVLDFCGPGLLEPAGDRSAWMDERSRLVEEIGSADALTVTGAAKVPHYLAWALQTGRDVRKMPIRLVEFCLPAAERERPGGRDSLRLVVFVYQDGLPGVADALLRHVGRGVTVSLVPTLQRSGAAAGSMGAGAFEGRDGVQVLAPLSFDELRSVLAQADLAVDLRGPGLAARYSSAAEAAVALASGVPVMHPSFGEMAAAMADYNAGWLLDEAAGLDAVLGWLRDDVSRLRVKAEGAVRLAGSRLDPAGAVGPLVEIIEGAG